MRKPLPKKTSIKSTPVSPISFRMPPALRARLRRFAKERNLAEAEALRLVVSEHLDQVENERELAAAERWQFKQAYATWQRHLRGEGRLVPWESIQQIFDEARAKRPTTDRTE
jgi:predicted DNA-binding protein